MATTRIAPPSIIARAGAELLDRIASRPGIDQNAAANAVGKAIEQLIARVYFRREGAIFFFTSRSRGRCLQHRTERDTCSCEAGQEGIPCWHRAARYLIIVLMQRQAYTAAKAAECAGELPPSPAYCRHCHHRMIATTTLGGEACYECENPKCQWTVMATLFATQIQADPELAQKQLAYRQRAA